MKMSIAFMSMSVLLLASGCIATAPVSVAWRSNTSQQYAATNGVTKKGEDANTINADKTTETQAAVNTSSGSARTAEQTGLSKEQEPVENEKADEKTQKEAKDEKP